MGGKSSLTIGVLALQGAVEKHVRMLELCGVSAVRIRLAEELDRVQGLIIPGGESTTIGKLMARYGMDKKIIDRAGEGMPIFGTCTGMILLAKDIVGSDQPRLGLMDISVMRNAFGRQIDSFETHLEIANMGSDPFPAVFIRAPYAVNISENTQVLARWEDRAVLVRQGSLLGCAFHPELTDDPRIHRYFVDMAAESENG